mgnify:FL=1
MAKPDQPRSLDFEDLEDAAANSSSNPTIGDVIAKRLSRRDLMQGMLATTAMTAAVSPAVLLAACSEDTSSTPNFNFPEVSAGVSERHYVADGYNADVLIRWGDKVDKDAPEFDVKAQTAEAQAKQFGYNSDFIGFVPLDGKARHGLLCINHDYTNDEMMIPGNKTKEKK